MACRSFDALVARHEFSDRQRVNGFMFFAGSVAYDYARNGRSERHETLAHYALLYMLVDTAMDVPGSYPQRLLGYAKALLEDRAGEPEDDACAAVRDAYLKCEGCREDFKELYSLQVQGTMLRRSQPLDVGKVWRIGRGKGGVTARILDRICTGGKHLDEAWRLGAVVQVLDDMLDIDDDTEAGVYTTADCAPFPALLDHCERQVPPALRECVELAGVVLAARYPERFEGHKGGISARCVEMASRLPTNARNADYVALLSPLIDTFRRESRAKCPSTMP